MTAAKGRLHGWAGGGGVWAPHKKGGEKKGGWGVADSVGWGKFRQSGTLVKPKHERSKKGKPGKGCAQTSFKGLMAMQ